MIILGKLENYGGESEPEDSSQNLLLEHDVLKYNERVMVGPLLRYGPSPPLQFCALVKLLNPSNMLGISISSEMLYILQQAVIDQVEAFGTLS